MSWQKSAQFSYRTKTKLSKLTSNQSATNHQPICARLETNYLSSQSGLEVLFQSSSYAPEYEYEYEHYPVYGDRIEAMSGMETTWGSGWMATYQQVCSEIQIEDASKPRVNIVKAISERWASTLPGFPTSHVMLFLNLAWKIVPSDPSCAVEFDAKIHNSKGSKFIRNEIPFMLLDAEQRVQEFGTDGRLSATSTSLTLVLFGVSPSAEFSFKYRQACDITAAPSHSPSSSSPSHSPSISPVIVYSSLPDGWSCMSNTECQSGKCSTQMLECVSANCNGNCSIIHSQVTCVQFSLVGCVCVWDASKKSKKCEVVP